MVPIDGPTGKPPAGGCGANVHTDLTSIWSVQWLCVGLMGVVNGIQTHPDPVLTMDTLAYERSPLTAVVGKQKLPPRSLAIEPFKLDAERTLTALPLAFTKDVKLPQGEAQVAFWLRPETMGVRRCKFPSVAP